MGVRDSRLLIEELSGEETGPQNQLIATHVGIAENDKADELATKDRKVTGSHGTV